MKKEETYVVGIDEAGRGPLAGPVSVGVACILTNFDWKLLPGVNDSKKLSEKKRNEIFVRAKQLCRKGILDYKVAMVSAKVIDDIGITKAVQVAMDRALARLKLDPDKVSIKLDGLLYAPKIYRNQETIIKGDQKEKVIGLASIMAKVVRDKYMIKKGGQDKFSKYKFLEHKGYGTQKHREVIVKNGLSTLHRRSYCKNI